MQASKELLEEAVNAIAYPIGVYKAVRNNEGALVDFDIEYVNEAICSYYGVPREKQIGKRLYRDVMPAHDARIKAAHAEVLNTGDPMTLESTLTADPVTGEPSYSVYRVHIAKCNDGIVVAGQDVTQEKELDLRTMQEAEKDDLTGLLSPVSFYSKLEQSIAESRRYGTQAAVIIIDLDGFKLVNDRFGHLYGNKALKKVAETLKQRIRESDAAGRFGGDEFILLLNQTSIREAVAVANEIRRAISSLHLSKEKTSTPVTASAGIFLIEKFSDTTTDNVLRGADESLYKAKQRGGDRVSVFE